MATRPPLIDGPFIDGSFCSTLETSLSVLQQGITCCGHEALFLSLDPTDRLLDLVHVPVPTLLSRFLGFPHLHQLVTFRRRDGIDLERLRDTVELSERTPWH